MYQAWGEEEYVLDVGGKPRRKDQDVDGKSEP
jgi:hypothetical protein